MIRTVFILLYNLIRNIIYRIRYKSRYRACAVERISPGASVRLYGRSKCRFGRNIELAPGVDIQTHGNGSLDIGERTYMNRQCMISCHNRVSIGAGCMFGPGVRIFDNNHKFSKDGGVSCALNTGEIIVGNNCWIASDVILLKGTHIGDNCVIGAGCIIDGAIPPSTIVRQKQHLDYQPIYK